MTVLQSIVWAALACTIAFFGIENASTYGGLRRGRALAWIDYHALQLMQTGMVFLLACAPMLDWWEAYGAIVFAMPLFQGFINVGSSRPGARLPFFNPNEDRTYHVKYLPFDVPKPITGRWRIAQFPLGLAITFYTPEVLLWVSTIFATPSG